VFGLDADTAANSLGLGARVIRFVPRVDRGGIVAVDLHAVDSTADAIDFDAGNVHFRVSPRSSAPR
jgi:hypothetical protein